MEAVDKEQVSMEEIVSLAVNDDHLFGTVFFPRAVRQKSPKFHKLVDNLLNDPDNRFCSIMLFRGAAKTTKLRVFTAKRIAYAISRTILYVGKSQDHAAKSLEWLMKQVEHNTKFASTFKLRPGKPWNATEIAIVCENFTDENGMPLNIRILAYGITGSIRGVNIDDYRPDLIIVDDPCDEENTSSPSTRAKMADLFFGALAKSLAPTSESPHAKMALLQTLLNPDDLVSMCDRDPQWKSLRISVFDEGNKSVWEERLPTKELMAEKAGYITRNQLVLWMREMECKIVARGEAAFQLEYVQYWELLPEGGITFLAVDPTPPPKDEINKVMKSTEKLDDTCIMVLRVFDRKIYVCDYYLCKSPNPEEFFNTLFSMLNLWRVKDVVFETVLFARLYRHSLQTEMNRRKHYFTFIPIEDRRNKPVRIRQEISAYLSNRTLYLNQKQMELLDQLLLYPNVRHDDILDALSIGLMHVKPWMLSASVIEGEYSVVDNDEDQKLLEHWRSAP